jgi:uncharacterized delta-60 repeat protein
MTLSACRKQKKASDGLGDYSALLSTTGSPVAFGTAAINTTREATLTITNSGSLVATNITPVALAWPFRFKDGVYPGTGGTCILALLRSESCTLVLEYAPTLGGVHTGTLSLRYLSGVDTQNVITTEIAILGGNSTNGAALNISDGTTYDFGTVVVGNTGEKTFTITNSGSLSAASVSAGTPNIAAPFTYKGGDFPGTGATCGGVLNTSSSCTIAVVFTPTVTGSASDTIRISYNDGLQTQSTERAVTATGQAPALIGISDGATYNYGNVYQTLTSDKTFTVTNSGGATATSLAAGTPALAAPFVYVGNSYPGGGTCGSSLAGSATCTLVVRFSPTAVGASSDTIRLSYNNGVSSQSAIRAVTGTGVGYAALSISDGSTYDFGSKYINTTTTDKTFTVTNSLSGTASAMSGADLSAPFAYVGGSYPGGGTCGASLAGGASCTIVVRYSPTSLGSHSGTLIVNYTKPDASTTTATRAMSGTGIGNPGDLDTTWDSDGKVATTIGAGNERAYAVIVQSDGKVVAAGYSYNGSNNDFAIVRYSTTGALDTSFDSDGKVTYDIGGNDIAYAIAIQSDGKIVVAGQSGSAGNLNFAVMRFTSSGAVDPSFGASGVATTDFSAMDDWIRHIAIDSNGKIVAVGSNLAATGTYRFAVARYGTDGNADTTFDSDGKAVYAPVSGEHNEAYGVAVQSDGKIVVAGKSNSGSYQFSVARLNSSGAVDSNFDSDGYAFVDLTGGTDIAKSVKIDSSGNIVLGGTTGTDLAAIVRLTSSGALDTTFDSDGIQTVDIGTGADDGTSIAIDSSGKIAIAVTATNSDKDFGVVRLTSAGALDTSFDTDGKLSTDFNQGNPTNDNSVYAIKLQSDGKIVVAGDYDTGSNADFAVMRYWP